MVYMKQVGARVKRKEDPRLITGSSNYTDDFNPRGVGHVAILRSVYGHARINGIDTSAAEAHPGVIAVFTGAQFGDMAAHMPHGAEESVPGMKEVQTPIIADDRVRHVGEAVAVVVAEDRYIARDALDLIQVDYDPLEVVTDLEAAIAPGAPQLYDAVPNNIAYVWERKRGDVDAAFAAAEVTVTQRMNNQRLAGIPLETRGVLAQPDPLSGGLTVTTSTQNPHSVRSQIAATLGLSEIDVRVVAPEVGGGFGVKISSYPEDMIVAALAKRLNQPVKWIESRSENLAATHHGRAQIAEVSLAAKRDGTVTALRMRVLADLGAFPRDPGIPPLTGMLMNGVYKFDTVDMEIRGVYTNTMATGAYRGAGRPEAAYYLERMMDLLAVELGMDPVEVRRKNFIPPDAFPYKTAAGPTYDSGDYEKPLAKVLAAADYQGLRAEQQRLRAEGRYLGIGVVTFTEICGFGPFDSATVRVEPSGKVTVATGISPHGQGQETTFAQIVADELGVSMDDVVVVHGDTARTPAGIGTMGSRGLAVGGAALYRGTQLVKEKAVKIAAHLLEASPEDVEFRDGAFGVKGAPEQTKGLTEIAKAAYGGKLPAEIGAGLESTDFFAPPNTTFPFGADIVVVEVDAETGEVSLRQYFAVDDCGRVISPLLVDGQVHGGLTQGIAQALWEEVVYDESGQLMTGTLMDYAVPKSEYLPNFALESTETPTHLNPLGAKGIGEAATIGSTPAVVNAV
ncbi:MAG: Aerobic carbon monoxide dehydrogenase (quinone), large chain, partial [uncultured Thermomicrobiales bacterium]